MSQRESTYVRDIILCSIAAVGTFAAFPTELAPEHSFWPLIWVSHVPLLWVLKDKAGPKQAFWWGLLCGTLINAGGYYWLSSMLRTFGQLPWVVAIFILILHQPPAWAHLGYLGSGWLTGLAIPPLSAWKWSAPMVMVAVEFVMPRIFPAYMGNSYHLFPPIMQVADIFGVTIVTFLIYRVNAVLFLWLRAVREDRAIPERALWVTAGMLLLALGYGGVRMHQYDDAMAEARSLKMGIVEGDVGIFQEETRDRIKNHLLIQQNLSAKLQSEGAELIIWPESAYRFADLPRRAERILLPPHLWSTIFEKMMDDRVLRLERRFVVLMCLFSLVAPAPSLGKLPAGRAIFP